MSGMRGQVIVLPGVKAPDAPGAVKLQLSSADVVASSMASLHRVMSPKSLVSLTNGGVAGYCRVSGEALIQKGSVPSVLRLVKVGSKPALGLSYNLGLAGLAFQPGSASKSYTQVAVVSVADPTDRVNFLFTFTDDTAISSTLRYDITTASPSQKVFVCYGSSNNPPHAEVARPAGTWAVVIVDYDDESRKVSIAVNQVDSFVENLKSVNHPVVDTSYFEVGYHASANGLRDAKVGDVYIFNESLRLNVAGMAQLGQLVAALKAEYGIA
ncbi:hypothetical protein [Pseudomonas sp. IT-P218]|uniref:hypothetical protein n=1 Tax=Pseudomonas sp. IT-P218 TaxID=3026449 RepID=UPI0039E089FE